MDEQQAAELRLKIKSLGYQPKRVPGVGHPVWQIIDDYITGIETGCGYLIWRDSLGWALDFDNDDIDFLQLPNAIALWVKCNELCLVKIAPVGIKDMADPFYLGR